MFQSLKKPPLCKEVEDQIKDAIYKGIYKNNEKLPSEQELVEQFQVSRSTVREALKNLQNMGMIHTKRGINAGAYIAEPSSLPITQNIENLRQTGVASFYDLLQARLYIEPSVTAHVAACHTQEDVDKLENLLNTADKLLGESILEARYMNVWFHVEVARITKNPIVIFLSESINNVYSNAIIERTRDCIPMDIYKGIISEHRKILQFIIDRNERASFEMMQQHLFNTNVLYSNVIPASCDKDGRGQLHKLPISKDTLMMISKMKKGDE